MPPESDASKAKGFSRVNRTALLDKIKRMGKRHQVYRALFLGKDGQLTAEAEYFFQDLHRLAGMSRRGFDPEARRAEWNMARADLVNSLHDGLLLDGAMLAALKRKLEGPMNND